MKEAIIYLKSIFHKNDTVILGVSGGPDSMCLLDIVTKLKGVYDLKIICAHVNHNLREEALEEKDLVEDYCKKNNIIFEYMKIEDYPNSKFSESVGREKRYQFFSELLKKYQAKYLMTAHHGDDLIETILMRIVRGSNLKGYAGISLCSTNPNYSIIRPLLFMTKEEIIEYLEKENIKYGVDKTNELDIHTRNRFRKYVLPFLKKEDPCVHKKFLQFNKELESTKEYINREISKIKSKVLNNNVINLNELKKIDIYLQRKLIEQVIEDIQKKYIFNINNKEIDILMDFIRNNTKGSINLADGFIGRISYNKLYIEKYQEKEDYNYILNDKVKIQNKYLIERINDSNEKSNYVIRLNSEEIKLPIIIRNRCPGDVIKLKKVGTKKIKDALIDSKIDTKERDVIPLVLDSENNILWIPGVKKSIFDKEINEKYDIILKCTEEKYE